MFLRYVSCKAGGLTPSLSPLLPRPAAQAMVGALYDLHLAGGAAAAAPPHVEVMLPLVCTDREVAAVAPVVKRAVQVHAVVIAVVVGRGRGTERRRAPHATTSRTPRSFSPPLYLPCHLLQAALDELCGGEKDGSAGDGESKGGAAAANKGGKGGDGKNKGGKGEGGKGGGASKAPPAAPFHFTYRIGTMIEVGCCQHNTSTPYHPLRSLSPASLCV